MPDFVAELGPLGLTLRLKRLADRLLDDGRKLYEALDVPLEPSWHALLLLLREHGSLSVTEAASLLNLSHPSVIETSRKLEKAGLVTASPDPGDRRRRLLSLSQVALDRMPELERLWAAFRDELAALLDTGAGELLASLGWLEAQLAERGLDRRVRQRLEAHNARQVRQLMGSGSPHTREIEPRDREGALHIARGLVRSADTYAYDPGMTDDELWLYWAPGRPGQGYVAELDGLVVGIFVIRPNQPGPGSHVANASYAVRADVRGLGLGRLMGESSLDRARELGFEAMQYNIVVGTNQTAIRLWRSLGFRVVGTVPDGFRLPDGTLVPHHIMYRSL